MSELSTEEFWAKVSTLSLSSLNLNGPTPVILNDEYFQDVFVKSFALKARPTPKDGILFAKSFLNFYLYYDNGGQSYLENTVLGLIASMKISESNYLVDENFFDGSSTCILESPDSVSKIEGLFERNLSAMNNQTAQQWYNTLWGHLSVETNTRLAQATINYLGYLCLQMMRSCTKDIKPVATHIVKYSIGQYRKFWKVNLGLQITHSPNDKSFERFSEIFEKSRVSCDKVLTMMVYSYIHGDTLCKDIYYTAALQALSYVGLGCYHWLLKAQEATGIPLTDLMKYKYINRHRSTNLAMEQFLEKYVNNPTEKTWPWARIFNDGAFLKIATKSDPTYAATWMAVSINGDANSPLWKIPQFEKNLNESSKNHCVLWAKAIIKKLGESAKQNKR